MLLCCLTTPWCITTELQWNMTVLIQTPRGHGELSVLSGVHIKRALRNTKRPGLMFYGYKD